MTDEHRNEQHNVVPELGGGVLENEVLYANTSSVSKLFFKPVLPINLTPIPIFKSIKLLPMPILKFTSDDFTVENDDD